jgi:hypothetical protein
MLNEHETQLAMEHFFKDCLNFWRRNTNDERVAFEKALNDTKRIITDPFSPCGKKLDAETKNKFIKYREMDLGIVRA